MENKSIKEYAREAKKRMKSGFWQKYNKMIDEENYSNYIGVIISTII